MNQPYGIVRQWWAPWNCPFSRENDDKSLDLDGFGVYRIPSYTPFWAPLVYCWPAHIPTTKLAAGIWQGQPSGCAQLTSEATIKKHQWISMANLDVSGWGIWRVWYLATCLSESILFEFGDQLESESPSSFVSTATLPADASRASSCGWSIRDLGVSWGTSTSRHRFVVYLRHYPPFSNAQRLPHWESLGYVYVLDMFWIWICYVDSVLCAWREAGRDGMHELMNKLMNDVWACDWMMHLRVWCVMYIVYKPIKLTNYSMMQT